MGLALGIMAMVRGIQATGLRVSSVVGALSGRLTGRFIKVSLKGIGWKALVRIVGKMGPFILGNLGIVKFVGMVVTIMTAVRFLKGLGRIM
jgi:hypothetical protein